MKKYSMRIARQYKEKMLTYCLECKKNTENEDVKMVKSRNNRIMLMSKCACVAIKSLNLLENKTLKDY